MLLKCSLLSFFSLAVRVMMAIHFAHAVETESLDIFNGNGNLVWEWSNTIETSAS